MTTPFTYGMKEQAISDLIVFSKSYKHEGAALYLVAVSNCEWLIMPLSEPIEISVSADIAAIAINGVFFSRT